MNERDRPGGNFGKAPKPSASAETETPATSREDNCAPARGFVLALTAGLIVWGAAIVILAKLL
jgi:hypothetical protein